jgi:hypothetical protein
MHPSKTLFSFYALVLSGSLLLFACKPTASTSTEKLKKSSSLQIANLEYEFYEAKAKIEFEDITQDIKSNADIRVKKDSAIWVSMRSGTGIEGVRALITPDSIRVVNRLDKEYYLYSLEELSEKFRFQLDFDMLQSIIVGNIPVNTKTKNKVERDSDHFIILGTISRPRANLTMYVNRFFDKVDKVEVIDRKNMNDLLIEYGEFKEIDGQRVPHFCKVKLNYSDERGSLISQLQVDATRITLADESLKFPFRVPDRYKRVELGEEGASGE